MGNAYRNKYIILYYSIISISRFQSRKIRNFNVNLETVYKRESVALNMKCVMFNPILININFLLHSICGLCLLIVGVRSAEGKIWFCLMLHHFSSVSTFFRYSFISFYLYYQLWKLQRLIFYPSSFTVLHDKDFWEEYTIHPCFVNCYLNVEQNMINMY